MAVETCHRLDSGDIAIAVEFNFAFRQVEIDGAAPNSC